MPGNLLCARAWERTKILTHSFYILVGRWIINKNRTSAGEKNKAEKGWNTPRGKNSEENIRLEQRGHVQRTQGRKLWVGSPPGRGDSNFQYHH